MRCQILARRAAGRPGGMSEDAPAWFHKPVAAALVAIAVVCIGAVSYLSLPIAELPAVDLPTIVVTAQLPGASPETMASTVATPIEKRIGQIAGVCGAYLKQRLGVQHDHHPVRHPARNLGRADRCTGGRQCRKIGTAHRHAGVAGHPKAQSDTRADRLPRGIERYDALRRSL